MAKSLLVVTSAAQKKLSKKLILLEEVFSFVCVDFLLRFFKGGSQGVKVVVTGEQCELLHFVL